MRRLFTWIRRFVGAALLGYAAYALLAWILDRSGNDLEVTFTVGRVAPGELDLGQAIETAANLAAARSQLRPDPELVALEVRPAR
jgi:hypothetical protein